MKLRNLLAVFTAVAILAISLASGSAAASDPTPQAVTARRIFTCWDVDKAGYSQPCQKGDNVSPTQTITVTPGKLLCFAVRGSEGAWVRFRAYSNGSQVGRTSHLLKLHENKDCVYRNQTGSNKTVYFRSRVVEGNVDPTGIEVRGTAYVQAKIDD